VQVLYVSPLKALINDQHRRLDEIAEGLGFPVHRWHGDVPASAKARLLDAPAGALLITPESLEALFVLRGAELRGLFGDLAYVVVDELHAFLGSERGRQLQSLLRRLELLLRRRTPRIGLSATLGDMDVARDFLRPEEPGRVDVVQSSRGAQRLLVALRGYQDTHEDRAVEQRPGEVTSAESAVVRHVFEHLRGRSNLVFANSRRDVEVHATYLRELSEERRVPNEFLAHHGSLSKAHREDVEARVRDGGLPTTVVCTSTLELGIDLGDVASVAQIGAPPSVASLRQRLGRSGRRGEPGELRVYVREGAVGARSAPTDLLRSELVRAIAMLDLCLEGWCEPRTSGALHLSTLIQQLLSLIAQHSGVSAKRAYEALCAHGPFDELDPPTFAALLRDMGAADLITQDARGTLLAGLAGERIIGHYTFYSAFQTSEEYRVVHAGQTLGTMPLTVAYPRGAGFVFAGRHWRVLDVDEERQVIEVQPGVGGDPPVFRSSAGGVHDRVRERMRCVLAGEEHATYLDAGARNLLDQGRRAYVALGLDDGRVALHEGDAWLFLWTGDRARDTLLVQLVLRGFDVSADGPALRVGGTDEDGLWRALGDLEADGEPDVLELAAAVPAQRREKYDEFLSDELLAREYAARALDGAGALATIRACLEGR
jgi:ATP-dependent Lhr-like helicase